MAFPRSVERWRAPLVKLAPDLPIEFLLAWISKESSGVISAKSAYDERSLFQIHPDEAKGMGMSDAQWNDILTSATASLKWGIALVRRYVKRAKGQLTGAGAPEWDDVSFYSLVKLNHAVPTVAKVMMEKYAAENGRGPIDWDELKTAVTLLTGKLKALANKWVPSAEKVGLATRSVTDHILLAILSGHFLELFKEPA